MMAAPLGKSLSLPRIAAACMLMACAWIGTVFLAQTWPSEAYFGGDSWEYQSMAVNFSQGLGLVAGQRLPIEHYMFSEVESSPALAAHFAETGRDTKAIHTYRTPAYPMFLGGLYLLFGNDPAHAYRAQTALLILFSFSLPVFGAAMFGRAGLIAGFFSCFWFLLQSLSMARQIMTEPLIVMHLFVLLFTFYGAERKRTLLRQLLWGVLVGMAPLVKGSLIFMPMLAMAWALGRKCLHRDRSWAMIAGLCFAAILPLLCWSAYISRIEGKPVFLSTQGNLVLLEGNNELCIQDGAWHPEYVLIKPYWIQSDLDTSTLYYNQPGISERPIPLQLLGFFSVHWKQAPRLFLNKFNRAFERFLPFKILVVCLLCEAIAALCGVKMARWRARLAILFCCLVTGVVATWLHPSFAEIGVWTAVLILLLGLLLLRRRTWPFIEPFCCLAFLNFTMITLMTFGLRRFVQVIDPFILFALGLLCYRMVFHVPTIKDVQS